MTAESVVVDASVALSWVLPGEDSQDVIKLRDRAADKPGILLFVPPTFWYEVANALWVAARRRRITPESAGEALSLLRGFFFEEWEPDPSACLDTALEQEISVYDAHDNACMESFFHTLKTELVYLNRYRTRAEAKQSIFEYTEF